MADPARTRVRARSAEAEEPIRSGKASPAKLPHEIGTAIGPHGEPAILKAVSAAVSEHRPGGALRVGPAAAAQIARAARAGRDLDAPSRATLRPVLGEVPKGIDVVRTPRSAELAAGFGATGFTAGRTVFLGPRRPSTPLLAHEVAHAMLAPSGAQPMAGSSVTVYRQTEDEPGAAELVMWRYVQDGKPVVLSDEEYLRVVETTLLPHVRSDLVFEVRSAASSARTMWDHFDRINADQPIVSWFAEAFGRASMPGELTIMLAEAAAKELDAISASTMRSHATGADARADLRKLEAALPYAERMVNSALNVMREYRDQVITGGGRAIAVLQVTKTLSFTAVAVMGSAVIAPGAASLSAASLLAGGGAQAGASVLQSVATETGESLFLDEEFSVGDIALDGVIGFVGGVRGAAVGGLLASKLAGPLATKLYPRVVQAVPRLGSLGRKAVEEMIEGALAGSASSATSQAFSDALAVLRGKATWDDLLVNVASAFTIGAVTGPMAARYRPQAQ